MAEIIYFRSTRVFIGANSFMLLDNLHGFESSIGMYLTTDLLLLLIPLCLTISAIVLFDNRRREESAFVIAIGCGIIVHTTNRLVANRGQKENTFGTSVVHMLFNTTKDLVCKPFDKPYEMTATDLSDIEQFVCNQGEKAIVKHPLVLILVESMETWAIRPDIMPNLYQFIQSHNAIYANKVNSQTKGGTSADGQMIYNTGLLPIQNGAVCFLYPNHIFPALSKLYDSTALVFPGSMTVWNQGYMNAAYHINTAFECPNNLDHIVFNTVDSISTGQYDYILTVTMASHSPFKVCSEFSSLPLPDDMPTNMRNYLHCLNYTDSCWGNFLSRIDTDSVLHNSVVCFMGDHIIFDPKMRGEFQEYCNNKELDFTPREAYTAFVAYSPDLQTPIRINEAVYQMDAYPTIRHLIGADNYYWRGFGIDLSDTATLHHRPITEEDAYLLSDKIIRADYFKEYNRQ